MTVVSRSSCGAFTTECVTAPTHGDLPVLRNWLEGRDDHPLRWFFQSRRETPRPPNARTSLVFDYLFSDFIREQRPLRFL